MMKTLLITANYPPEIGGAAHLIHELALSLQHGGHEVTVLTGYPRYHLSVVPPAYRRGFLMNDRVDGIPVRRIRIPSLPAGSKVARGVQHFVFGLWLAAMFALGPRPNSAVVFSPPLPLPWLVCLVARLRRIPVVVNVQDLFPREAVELGMLSNPLLIRAFESMERQVYRLAARITVHSPGNRDHVIKHGGGSQRVQVVYNWVDTDRVRPSARDNDFARQYGLQGRFVVSYAGTMGWAQDMDTIVDAAACLRGLPEILFVLVGEGVEKEKAQARCEAVGLENVLWLPMQPWSLYPQILAASDVCMINLNSALRTPVVPSKLLNIMAAGRAVVASLPLESDARPILAEAGCGICVGAGDGGALADAIRRLAAEPGTIEEMGRRGRIYAERHFGREACTGQIEAILKSIVGGGACRVTEKLSEGKSYL